MLEKMMIFCVYEVNFKGIPKKIALYFNIYEKGQILCPKGLKIKRCDYTSHEKKLSTLEEERTDAMEVAT